MVKSVLNDVVKEMDKVKIMTKLILIQMQLLSITSKNNLINNELEIIDLEIQECINTLAK